MNIEKTIQFVQDLFEQSEYLKAHPKQKEYRLNHTYRVARIGKKIGEHENVDQEALIIGCLLHDISYVHEFKTKEESKGHGRKSAEMAREFVYSLNMEDHLKEEILFGVAIHVDDKSDFEGNRTILAESISECDNIDRFDKYRLYESLLYSNLDEMSLEEQLTFTESRVESLIRLKNYVFQTATSNDMWQANLDYQIDYFKQLLEQLKTSNYKELV